VQNADLILLFGGRLGEQPSQGYTLLDIPAPRQTLVHVFPGVEELGRVYRAHLAINATPKAFAAALEGLQPPPLLRWGDEMERAHADFLAWTDQPTVVLAYASSCGSPSCSASSRPREASAADAA
jgi:acetolactate synthase-1/2/3 large subunit